MIFNNDLRVSARPYRLGHVVYTIKMMLVIVAMLLGGGTHTTKAKVAVMAPEVNTNVYRSMTAEELVFLLMSLLRLLVFLAMFSVSIYVFIRYLLLGGARWCSDSGKTTFSGIVAITGLVLLILTEISSTLRVLARVYGISFPSVVNRYGPQVLVPVPGLHTMREPIAGALGEVGWRWMVCAAATLVVFSVPMYIQIIFDRRDKWKQQQANLGNIHPPIDTERGNGGNAEFNSLPVKRDRRNPNPGKKETAPDAFVSNQYTPQRQPPPPPLSSQKPFRGQNNGPSVAPSGSAAITKHPVPTMYQLHPQAATARAVTVEMPPQTVMMVKVEAQRGTAESINDYSLVSSSVEASPPEMLDESNPHYRPQNTHYRSKARGDDYMVTIPEELTGDFDDHDYAHQPNPPTTLANQHDRNLNTPSPLEPAVAPVNNQAVASGNSVDLESIGWRWNTPKPSANKLDSLLTPTYQPTAAVQAKDSMPLPAGSTDPPNSEKDNNLAEELSYYYNQPSPQTDAYPNVETVSSPIRGMTTFGQLEPGSQHPPPLPHEHYDVLSSKQSRTRQVLDAEATSSSKQKDSPHTTAAAGQSKKELAIHPVRDSLFPSHQSGFSLPPPLPKHIDDSSYIDDSSLLSFDCAISPIKQEFQLEEPHNGRPQ